MIFMSCFCGAGVKSYNFGPGIRLKFRINILLQHRELHTADFQHLAVKFFQVKILAQTVLLGGAQVQKA